eukprot:jgi/Botrbrau1/19975/Bobra.0059s0090.1
MECRDKAVGCLMGRFGACKAVNVESTTKLVMIAGVSRQSGWVFDGPIWSLAGLKSLWAEKGRVESAKSCHEFWAEKGRVGSVKSRHESVAREGQGGVRFYRTACVVEKV